MKLVTGSHQNYRVLLPVILASYSCSAYCTVPMVLYMSFLLHVLCAVRASASTDWLLVVLLSLCGKTTEHCKG